MAKQKKQEFQWQDPEYFGEGKLPGRNLTLPFGEKDSFSWDVSPYKISLNGSWRFFWQQDLRTGLEKSLWAADYDDSSWDLIPVPSVWQLEGYGKPFYLASWLHTDHASTKKQELPEIYPEKNEAGVYRRSFSVPETWDGRRILLQFGAAKSALEVYLNGQRLGYSQGSMTPAEFDLTEQLLPGENQLTAIVYRFGTGYYLEDQDMWNFSGLYREVSLVAEPKATIWDFFADTSVGEDHTTGVLDLSVELQNPENLALQVKAFLDGEALPGDAQTLHFELPGAKLWSAEEPNLYSLELHLVSGEDILVKKRVRIGFRKIEISGNILKINGKRVVIKGVNRHDFDPDHGWAVPRERYYDDLYLMKRANINAIRCSHYPDDPFFYELCDELGFYVMDEADVESHGVRNKNCPGDDPRWIPAVIDRAERMVSRDRSHACVCFWSLGNEAGSGRAFLEARRAVEALDSSRPIHYEGDDTYQATDFISRMYPPQSLVKKLREQKEVKINLYDRIANRIAADNKAIPASQYATHPVIYCEFAHAMENSLGDFRELCDDFEQYEHMCGGFIWDYVDQSIRNHEKLQSKENIPEGAWIYGGDFGEKKSSYYFCANGIIGADRVPHPAWYEVKQVYANVCATAFDPETRRVTLKNKHLFLTLQHYEVHWSLSCDGRVVQKGELAGLEAAPGDSCEGIVPYDGTLFPEAGELLLTISFRLRGTESWAPAGYEMRFDQYLIRERSVGATRNSPEPVSLEAQKQGGVWTFTSPCMKAVFQRGQLSSLDFGAGELLHQDAEPHKVQCRPNLFRALTDNDMGYTNFTPQIAKYYPLRLFRLASRGTVPLSVTLKRLALDCAVVTVHWFTPLVPVFQKTIYTIHATGQIDLKQEVLTAVPLLKSGVKLGLNAKFGHVQWYGRGPHESQFDRKTGQKVALHQCNVEELEHRYMRPQENGTRSDTRFVSFTDGTGSGLRVTAGGKEIRAADAGSTTGENRSSGREGYSAVSLASAQACWGEEAGAGFYFTALPYSVEQLDDADHLYDLRPEGFTTLCLDGFQRGVGGDVAGTASLHPQYQLLPGKYVFELSLTQS